MSNPEAYVPLFSHHDTGSIQWATCPDTNTMQCGYLTVPMDYDNPRANETVSIFLRRLPAFAPVKDRLGSLLLNPGGPGGSGSEAVFDNGRDIAEIVQGRYDIIGFDPRGVNMTTPHIGCTTSPSHMSHFHETFQRLGTHFEARHSLSPSNATLAMHAPLSALFENAFASKFNAILSAGTKACLTTGNQAMIRSVTTSLVVKDMNRILEELGDDKRGLVYWGKSYGTILGATFAAMYPDKVHRLVLDGVADAVSYHRNFADYGRSGMSDTNKTYTGFLSSCVTSAHCALAPSSPNASHSIDSLRSRITALLQTMSASPLSVPVSPAGPGVLTSSDLTLYIFTRLYNPSAWPFLAQGLADAEKGKGETAYADLYGYFTNSEGYQGGDGFLTTVSIMCTDTAKEGRKMNSQEYLHYIHELGQMSPIGENWAHWQGWCRYWDIEARERYNGPWSREEGLQKLKNPILFVSQTGDPVTPLSNARNMVRAFGNDSASLLIQNGFGHCSSAHPSTCTAQKIRSYLVDGVLPDYGTTCEVDPGYLFPNPKNSFKSSDFVNSPDSRLQKALHNLANVKHWAPW